MSVNQKNEYAFYACTLIKLSDLTKQIRKAKTPAEIKKLSEEQQSILKSIRTDNPKVLKKFLDLHI